MSNVAAVVKALRLLAGERNLRQHEPLARHTTFQVGGPADYFVRPASYGSLTNLIKYALEKHLPWFILGKGSNLIISDKGIRGLVISTLGLTHVYYKGDQVTAAAGFDLVKLASHTAARGLSGLEFACGIPGSVGGAVFMNAGAYDNEISRVLVSSQVLMISGENGVQPDLEVITLTNSDHAFSYRHSVLQEKPFIHLNSTFRLVPENKRSIKSEINKLTKARSAKQPLDLPSAGSVFRRPQGYFTGALIEQCGLRGFRIGGAAVSEKHCGFIVNLGGATAADILAVIEHVRGTVLSNCGIELKTEVRFVGEI